MNAWCVSVAIAIALEDTRPQEACMLTTAILVIAQSLSLEVIFKPTHPRNPWRSLLKLRAQMAVFVLFKDMEEAVWGPVG